MGTQTNRTLHGLDGNEDKQTTAAPGARTGIGEAEACGKSSAKQEQSRETMGRVRLRQ